MSPARSFTGASAGGASGSRLPLERPKICNEEGLGKVRRLVGSDSNEWGATDIVVGATVNSDLSATHYLFFVHTLLAGLVPPFFPFFLAVLEHYQVQALHLHPDAVTLLAAFTFACEAFVGVDPSVALLRHFFHLRLTMPEQHSGCVSFRAVDGLSFLGMNWTERTQGF
jgi:hypothetical protein